MVTKTSLLAIDAGGTSTRAVLLNREGLCIGYGTAGGGNPISSGPERAASAVLSAARQASEAAGVGPAHIERIIMAMAGARTYTSSGWVTDEFEAWGFSGQVSIDSDLLAIFCSGGPEPAGYAMVAGTGAAAVRVENGRVTATADGLGWLLGDHGSGYWIGHQVTRAAVDALDGRGETTALAPLMLEALGIPDTEERGDEGRLESLRLTTDALYDLIPVQLSRFAPLAFAAGDDPVAKRILTDAAAALARTLQAARNPDVTGPLVFGGSILAQPGILAEALASELAGAGISPDARRVSDGAVGAAVLALRHAGIEVDQAVFDRVRGSLAELRT